MWHKCPLFTTACFKKNSQTLQTNSVLYWHCARVHVVYGFVFSVKGQWNSFLWSAQYFSRVTLVRWRGNCTRLLFFSMYTLEPFLNSTRCFWCWWRVFADKVFFCRSTWRPLCKRLYRIACVFWRLETLSVTNEIPEGVALLPYHSTQFISRGMGRIFPCLERIICQI